MLTLADLKYLNFKCFLYEFWYFGMCMYDSFVVVFLYYQYINIGSYAVSFCIDLASLFVSVQYLAKYSVIGMSEKQWSVILIGLCFCFKIVNKIWVFFYPSAGSSVLYICACFWKIISQPCSNCITLWMTKAVFFFILCMYHNSKHGYNSWNFNCESLTNQLVIVCAYYVCNIDSMYG